MTWDALGGCLTIGFLWQFAGVVCSAFQKVGEALSNAAGAVAEKVEMTTLIRFLFLLAAVGVRLCAQALPPIAGGQGTWNITITANRPGGPDSISIRFTPTVNAAGCRHIRLIQYYVARGYDAGGNVLAGTDEDMYPPPAVNPFPQGTGDEVILQNPDGSSQMENGHVIKGRVDHDSCEGDPYYNGDDVGQDVASNGDASTGASTTMSDTPSEGFGRIPAAIVRDVTSFETCAVCQDTGACLGCIHWTSTATRAPADQGQIAVSPAEFACSPGMTAAIRQFCRRHTARDTDGTAHWYCPDDGSLKPTAIPGGAYRKYLFNGIPEVAIAYRAAASVPGFASMNVQPMGGTTEVSLAAALADLKQVPQSGMIALAWLGEQKKTIVSVAFGIPDKVPPETLSSLPFLRRGIQAVRYVTITAGQLQGIEEAIADTGSSKEGLVELMVLARSNSERLEASSTVLSAGQFQTVLGALRRIFQDDPNRMQIVRFLAGNYGQPAPTG